MADFVLRLKSVALKEAQSAFAQREKVEKQLEELKSKRDILRETRAKKQPVQSLGQNLISRSAIQNSTTQPVLIDDLLKRLRTTKVQSKIFLETLESLTGLLDAEDAELLASNPMLADLRVVPQRPEVWK